MHVISFSTASLRFASSPANPSSSQTSSFAQPSSFSTPSPVNSLLRSNPIFDDPISCKSAAIFISLKKLMHLHLLQAQIHFIFSKPIRLGGMDLHGDQKAQFVTSIVWGILIYNSNDLFFQFHFSSYHSLKLKCISIFSKLKLIFFFPKLIRLGGHG